MGLKIDVRIMNLNKWYVPKSFSMDDLEEPVILGFFDALHVRKIQIDPKRLHPFAAGYEKLAEWKNEEKKALVDYSSQEQMLFLDICEKGQEEGVSFSQETVDRFWNDKTCPYIFLSMIHINHSGNLNRALKKLKEVFEKDYLSYVSFDYCDIVLFAHNMQICDFITKIKSLFEVEDKEDKVIFDTFSMVCFWPSFVQGCCECGCLCQNEEVSGFHATINISIRDYKRFKVWYSEIQEMNPDIKLMRYYLFGRHDMSIVNEHADNVWLMQIMQKLHEEDSQGIFWTFETYIKIPDEGEITMNSDVPEDMGSVYCNVRNNLEREIKGLEQAIEAMEISGENRYLLPIYEVRDCICSIVKNSFAEEFIYCIYESFLHFVSYVKNEIERISSEERECMFESGRLAGVYDKYFTALNTLVNSTMHSERQFVQATAFNAVFYSVPPKILAFYNAYIYRVKQILRDVQCIEQYTFLIYPSFSPVISVEQISLDDEPPSDRILTVRINEKSLYDIESVLYQMVHELAHYVGHGLRCRAVRKMKIMHTLLKHIVGKCRMDEEIYQVLSRYINVTFSVEREEADSYNHDYLQYMKQEGRYFLHILEEPQVCNEIFVEYYHQRIVEDKSFCDDLLRDFGIGEEMQRNHIMELLPQYCDIKYEMFCEQLKKMDSYEEVNEYEAYIELLKSVYSECYADLQMILVLAMKAEDYLSTFFIKQGITAWEMLFQPEFMIRISTIYRVMTDTTMWKVERDSGQGGFHEVIQLIDEYNNDVKGRTNAAKEAESQRKICQIKRLIENYDFNNGIKLRTVFADCVEGVGGIGKDDMVSFTDAANGLYEYLLEVMEKSLREYAGVEKRTEIQKIREIVAKVLAFENTEKVFDCIEKELNAYKENGCKI